MRSYGLMNLQSEKQKIDKLLFDIGFQYLHDLGLRSRFMAEEQKIAENYLNEYTYGKLDFSQAMQKIRHQYQILIHNHMSLQMGSIKLFVIAQREKNQHAFKTLALKNVGFISGIMQFIGGRGLCKASLGAACKAYGAPLMIQGAENTWENGYYLLYHEDPKIVPVRYAWRYVAKILGGDETDGDIAFSTGDLVLSLGSASTLTLKPDSWKLFRYIREDYIRNWRTLGVAGGAGELIGDTASGFTIYQLSGEESTNWAELGR